VHLSDVLLPALGVLTGLVLGLLGSGGSSLALPAFLLGAGLPMSQAVPASLAVVAATALFGALLARRRCVTVGCPGSEADLRTAALFGAGGVVSAFAGARLALLLSDRVQALLFVAILLAAAAAMLRSPGRPLHPTEASPPPRWIMVVLGAGVGLLTGLLGVGGGFLIVPALTLAGGMPIKRASATSLWIITAQAVVGLAGYVGRVHIPWGSVGLFILAGAVGMAIGQAMARRARPGPLRTAFAGLLVVVALMTAVKALA